MKDEEAQMATNITTTSSTTITTTMISSVKKEGFGVENNGFFGRGKYKLWALTAIILLALWSMFTGTVTLKWSTGNFNHVSDEFDSPLHDDLDILDVEEREKTVRQMWNVYTHSSMIRLPSFWQAAFKSAYEELTSDVPAVRNKAIYEIAKMSLRSSLSYDVEFESPPVESNIRVSERKDRQSSRLGKTRRRI